MDNLYFSISNENALDTHIAGKVVWLHFNSDCGKHAMINLNNLAYHQNGQVIQNGMYKAIRDYIKKKENR